MSFLRNLEPGCDQRGDCHGSGASVLPRPRTGHRCTWRAIAGATVRAVDQDLRTETYLGGDVETDALGDYSISYDATAFAANDIGRADIVVRVLDGERVLAE